MAEPFWKRLPEFSWRRALRWAGYPLFFLFCFVLFAYWTFPYEKLRDRLVELAAQQGYELEIIDLSPSRLSGVTLEGVRLVIPGKGEDPPVDVLIDELTVRASWLSALTSTKSFTFSAELAGGDADGDVSIGEDDFEVDAEFDAINLKRIGALRRFTKLPVEGTLTGELSIAMPSEVAESTGSVDLTIGEMTIGDGESKVTVPGWGGLTLDKASVGDLEIQATIEEGKAAIDRFKADGEDIKLDVLGQIKLARPIPRSQMNLIVKAKIEDAYKTRSPKVATMIDLASTGKDYQAALTPDGSLQYKINGSAAGRIRPVAAGKEPFKQPGNAKR
ncbi:MAG: type II secretion system protein GspN [Myxococcota bacterium]